MNTKTDEGLCEGPQAVHLQGEGIDEFAGWARPHPVDGDPRLLDTELANKERARRQAPAPRPVPPSSKGLDGYDFTDVRLPDGYMPMSS